ncbi:MAG: CoA pyrophosphatase [Chloroflexi bacterium]|nr:CoA pyrophosphatase [Chloroflexota bacterium]
MFAAESYYYYNMKQRLREALALRRKRHIVDPDLVSAAVLLPIYRKDGQYHILLIRRTETVKKHKGEISFPGGVYEERDGSLLETALRESAEEIGLKAGDVEILGELDDEVSVTTNYVISPFIAAIPWPYRFRLDRRETEEIIEAPIDSLLKSNYLRPEIINGETVTADYYKYRDRIIWGATARILNKFLAILAPVLEDEPPG